MWGIKLHSEGRQDGRSMVEMLGVLAIIGVLSVGAIAGYSKAMEKYKINKAIDQISYIVSAVRTAFANDETYDSSLQNGYDDSDEKIKKLLMLGIISEDMVSSSVIFGVDGVGTKIVNPFQGGIWVNADDGWDGNKAFVLTYGGLSKDICLALATQDWNTIGVNNVIINGNDGDTSGGSDQCGDGDEGFIEHHTNSAVACPGGKVVPIPIPLTIAETVCSNCENDCVLLLGFKN